MKPILIRENNFEKARKLIGAARGEEIIFSGSNDELNRKILEKEPVSVLLINLTGRKDRMKQRDSGFNQVLAKLAKKNDVAIGIDLDEIIATHSAKEKAKLLARIQQNIKLCAKNKVKMEFVSKNKKDDYSLKALGLILGMPTWVTKNLNILNF